MNYLDFDPYLIRKRNEELLQEVHLLRREKQLRENREPGEAHRSWPKRLSATFSRFGRPTSAGASRG